MKKLLSCLLAGACLLASTGVASFVACAEEAAAADAVASAADESGALRTYREYRAAWDAVYPDATYVIAGRDGQGDKAFPMDSYEGKDGVLRLEDGAVTFPVSVEEAGYYQLGLTYAGMKGKGKNLELGVKINGATPFDKAVAMEFNRLWKNETAGDFVTDSRGNDVLPDQVEVIDWIERDFRDPEGMYAEPFWFYFEQGANTVTLENHGEPLVIAALTLHPAAKVPSYAQAKPQTGTDAVTDFSLYLEGEKADIKSAKTIIPTYNKGDPAVSPASPQLLLRNTLGGGTSWQAPNEYVTWNFTVPKDGCYKIGVKYSQNQQRGLYSARRIYLNGEVVYDELNEVLFPYSSDFSNLVLSAGGEEMLFYLETGVDYALTMETTIGSTAEDLRVLDDALDRLNAMYRKIIMVTGANPDLTRDYNLDEEIPELLATFNSVADTLENEYHIFSRIAQRGGSEAVTLSEIVDKLRSFTEKPYTIAERLSTYRDSLSSLATWLIAREQQPLEIDYVMVYSPDQTMPSAKSSFWAKVCYEWESFLSSYMRDYNSIGTADAEDSVEVWVSGGREQSLIVRELVDAEFYAATGIPVTVKLVKMGLVQCVMAGVGPDVALSVERTLPVNLALRNALVDLSQFEGYGEVTRQFADTAMDPYLFNGGCYGIPETQSFHMMFYRTDIFKDLNIAPPDNWVDFYKVVNIIQRNNMEIGLPYAVDTNMFPTLLLQNGGSFYNEEHTASMLSTAEGLKAFTQWTEFYTQYSFSMVKDDYNRFRTGEMPLTIMPYVFYNQLKVAAPEIKGLWRMVQIPGTLQADGTVSRTESATGTANIMFKGVKNREDAWTFLRWWSGAEAQAAYGQKIETVLGAAGRYASANLEAVTMLPWTEDELSAIDEQRRWVVEIPEVAGGYYMNRNINNAFLAVVNRSENLWESLKYWDNETNREILRKRRELGLDPS